MKNKVKFILPICIVAMLVVYSLITFSMRDRMPGNTKVNGIDCSFLSYKSASEKLTQNIETRNITLTNAGENVKTINAGEYASLSFSSETMNQIGSSVSIPERLLFFLYKFDYEKEPEIIINSESLNMLLKTLGGTDKPQNAYIAKEYGEFIIVPEKNGNIIDSVTASKIITDAIRENKNEVDISEAFIKAGILSTDEELNKKKDTLNTDFNFKIKFVYKDGVSAKTTVLIGDELYSLYKTDKYGVPYVDNNGQYEVDRNAVKEYVETIIPEDYSDKTNETTMQETSNNGEGLHISAAAKTREEKVKEQTEMLIKALKGHTNVNLIIE